MKELKPNGQRAKNAILLMWIMFGLEIVSLISSCLQYSMLQAIRNGETVSEVAVDTNDLREGIIGILYLAGYIATLIYFIMWFRRAYFNLHMRVPVLNHSEGWAAGAWFVPILNLYLPCQIMHELYAWTRKLLSHRGAPAFSILSTTTVGWWWAMWLINGLVGQFVFRYSLNADGVDELITSTFVSIVGCLTGILMVVLSIKVIDDYSKAEAELAMLSDEEEVQTPPLSDPETEETA